MDSHTFPSPPPLPRGSRCPVPPGDRDVLFWPPFSFRVSAPNGICHHRPGDICLHSFMLFNVEIVDHCCFFFNKNLFCWFQSPIDLCHLLSLPFCAPLDMAPGEFSGVYLSCVSVCSPLFPSVESRWRGWRPRDTPRCCRTAATTAATTGGQPDSAPGH